MAPTPASFFISPSTTLVRSRDGRDVTFLRAGPEVEARVERFVKRLRSTLPIYGATKLPKRRTGLAALANAEWLTREEYQGPLRDQAFELIERRHFVQDLSSGTTGEPVVRFNTWSDELAEQLMTRRCFGLFGLGPGDRVVCLEIGAPEISAFYFRAMAELGVADRSYLHVSTDFFGSIEPLRGLDPTCILTVPGVLARCAPRFFDLYGGGGELKRRRKRALKKAVFYAEPVSPALRARLASAGVESFSFYGTTELGGAAGECRCHDGLHVMDDWIFPTLRDAEEIAPGRFRGEVAWTAMHFEVQPLLKYAVGDVVEIDASPCACGAPGVRLHFVERTHDVVSVYGLKFGYRPIEAALVGALGVDEPLVQLVLTDAPKGMAMRVKVCRDHNADEARVREALYRVFEIDEMLDMGYLEVSIEHVDRSHFEERKLRRVVDLRSDAPFDGEHSTSPPEAGGPGGVPRVCRP